MNVAKPILQRTIPPSLLPPFLLDEKVYDTLAETPVLREEVLSPSSTWTFARKSKGGEKMPQTIAHRGYKAEYPENTMGAFKGAVSVGAHALETDLHISKDDVVVISHDATLKRCYGKDEKIRDCTWDYLSQQRTLRAPHEPMPRLQDLLEYLATPGLEHIWLLLDIKMTNDAETIMRLIAHAISLVSPSAPWNKRLVLGIWAAKFLPYCAQYLPDYPISHIGFSIPYARQFLALPNISFNTLQKSLMGPRGASFIRDVKAKNRPLYVWTVNEEYFMRWSIERNVDGVITDDPKKFIEVCERWEKGDRKMGRMTWEQVFSIMWINFMVLVFGGIFRRRAGGSAQIKSAKGYC